MSKEGLGSLLNDNRKTAGTSILAFSSLFIFPWVISKAFSRRVWGFILRTLLSVRARRAEQRPGVVKNNQALCRQEAGEGTATQTIRRREEKVPYRQSPAGLRAAILSWLGQRPGKAERKFYSFQETRPFIFSATFSYNSLDFLPRTQRQCPGKTFNNASLIAAVCFLILPKDKAGVGRTSSSESFLGLTRKGNSVQKK